MFGQTPARLSIELFGQKSSFQFACSLQGHRLDFLKSVWPEFAPHTQRKLCPMFGQTPATPSIQLFGRNSSWEVCFQSVRSLSGLTANFQKISSAKYLIVQFAPESVSTDNKLGQTSVRGMSAMTSSAGSGRLTKDYRWTGLFPVRPYHELVGHVLTLSTIPNNGNIHFDATSLVIQL